jgi:uncharacterized protein YegP (UPF0339 family)
MRPPCTYHIGRSLTGFRWRLIDSDGETVAGSSHDYSTIDGCREAIELVKSCWRAPVTEDLAHHA